MGPRNLIILFFSTLMVSLVIMVIFFSLIFKNMDFDFNTKLPNEAPDVEERFKKKADDIIADPIEHTEDGEELSEEEAKRWMAQGAQSGNAKPNKRSRILDIEGAVINVPGGEPLGAEEESDIAGAEQGALSELEDSENVDTAEDITKKYQTSGNGENEQQHHSFLDSMGGGYPGKPVNKEASKKDDNAPPVPVNPSPVNSSGVPLPGVSGNSSEGNSQYQVYIDGFDNPEDARQLAGQLKNSGAQPYVKIVGGRPVVQIGVFSSKANADSTASRVGAKVRKIK